MLLCLRTLSVLVLLFVIQPSSGNAEDERWKIVHKSEDAIFYIDTKTVSPLSQDVVKVWVKVVSQEKPILPLQKIFKKLDKKATGEEHTKNLLEMECPKGKYRTVESISYDRYGSITNSSGYSDGAPWMAVTPESAEEKIYDEVCKTKAKMRE